MKPIKHLKPSLIITCVLSIALLLFFAATAIYDLSAEPLKEDVVALKPAVTVTEKKANFFAFLEPLIDQANSEVAQQRKQLFAIKAALPSLNNAQKEQLLSFSKTYRVKESIPAQEQVAQLERKINTIPASLVIAQAANESAWGTSRFARKGNNFFGQWCFSKGCGIVPDGRNDDASHEVASFDSPLASVKSYIKNLNRHRTYKPLRDLRQQALANGKTANGETLAKGLIGYSQRRDEYVKEIQQMIRYNKLSRFNKKY